MKRWDGTKRVFDCKRFHAIYCIASHYESRCGGIFSALGGMVRHGRYKSLSLLGDCGKAFRKCCGSTGLIWFREGMTEDC